MRKQPSKFECFEWSPGFWWLSQKFIEREHNLNFFSFFMLPHPNKYFHRSINKQKVHPSPNKYKQFTPKRIISKNKRCIQRKWRNVKKRLSSKICNVSHGFFFFYGATTVDRVADAIGAPVLHCTQCLFCCNYGLQVVSFAVATLIEA